MTSAQTGIDQLLVDLEWKIFESGSDHFTDSLLLAKAKIYKQNEEYHSALKTLDRIEYYSSATMEGRVNDERIVLHFLLNNDAEVKNLILQSTFIPGYSKSTEILLIESLNYVRLQDIENAKQSLSHLVTEEKKLEDVFHVSNFKNPDKAFMLSFLMPGLGQAYVGKPLKGLWSLSLNATLFYMGLNGIRRDYLFTEAIPSIALFQGFYFGGANYAQELAEEKNEEVIQELSVNILNSIK